MRLGSAQDRSFEAANSIPPFECEQGWEARHGLAWTRRCLARVHQVQLRLLSWAMRRLGVFRWSVLLRGNRRSRRPAKLIHHLREGGHNFVPENQQHPKNAGKA